MEFCNFLNSFTIIFEFSITGWVETHGNDFFLFSLFLSFSQPNLVRKDAMMVFSDFLNFFTIFLEFSITGRVDTDQDNFFYFLSFLRFYNLFSLEKKV